MNKTNKWFKTIISIEAVLALMCFSAFYAAERCGINLDGFKDNPSMDFQNR